MSNVLVYAPATLEAGFSFEANVDGRTFTVVVPEGGVEKGQAMEVPYPEFYEGGAVAGVGIDGGTGPIMGRWKHGLFQSCGDVSAKGCWMSLCCGPIVMAQLLTRMGMTWDGRVASKRSQVAITYGVVVLLLVSALYMDDAISEDFPFFRLAFLVYIIVIGTRLRHNFRARYSIPPSCCGRRGTKDDHVDVDDDGNRCSDYCDDCCCMFWCRCCSMLQILRHTHDETRYPYEACTVDGLPYDSPPPLADLHNHHHNGGGAAANNDSDGVLGTSTVNDLGGTEESKQGSMMLPVVV